MNFDRAKCVLKPSKEDPQLYVSCYQLKLSVPGTGYIQVKVLAKGSHRKPIKMKAIAKTIGGSPQIDGNVLTLKTAYTQGIEHKGVDTLLSYILFSYVFVFMISDDTLQAKHQAANSSIDETLLSGRNVDILVTKNVDTLVTQK